MQIQTSHLKTMSPIFVNLRSTMTKASVGSNEGEVETEGKKRT